MLYIFQPVFIYIVENIEYYGKPEDTRTIPEIN
jgi:hypothetical protein